MTMFEVYLGLLALAVVCGLCFLPRWGQAKAQVVPMKGTQRERGYASGMMHCQSHGADVAEQWVEMHGIGDEYDRAYEDAITDFRNGVTRHV